MKTMTRLFLMFMIAVAISPFVSASGCYYDPNGGVSGCRSVDTWGSYDSWIKSQTLASARSDPGQRYMAWCPTQNGVPYVRSDSKLSTCGCPSEAAFDNSLSAGQCDTRKCSNCGNYVSYCKPGNPAYCGDGVVNQPSESCELPNTNNNQNCGQATTACSGTKTGTRDSFGNCNSACGCNQDSFTFQCVKGSCGAQCAVNSDCNDNNPNTQDTCNTNSCGCSNVRIPKCGDGIPDYGEQCDDGNSNNNDACTNTCKNARCGDTYLWAGHEQCEPPNTNNHASCNDNNPKTQDNCDSACGCTHVTVCADECVSGQHRCQDGDSYVCGNFDSDVCTEWGNPQDCGTTTCTSKDKCQNNDVFTVTECVNRGCTASTGLCYTNPTSSITLKEDCGDDSETGLFCKEDNVVFGISTRYCVEQGNTASCKDDSRVFIVDRCGPDTCTEYTQKDIFVKEYVNDTEGCGAGGKFGAHCLDDPGKIEDVCVSENMLNQAICEGKDHAFQPFDCNTKDGCYDFQYTGCVQCPDDYGNCVAKNCTRTGREYRDYKCGDGACSYTVGWVDTDADKVDDRCDSCIDVDKDDICDDKDNCVGTWNDNQIDRDHDGVGDSCDTDRDGDGYGAPLDCNDWNANIHPGAKEILNNGLDDDCDSGTDDRIANTARQALYVDIEMQEESSLKLGGEMSLAVSITNYADDLD
ncbi:MAG: hypothetical protein HGA85_06955 [Nanoarchaeota archaeon]|nr:hypothetical protein [Nanoarchaeota archaeon]